MQYQINICIKFIIINFILLIAINKGSKIKEDDNSLMYYLSYSICKFLYFRINYNCSKNIFIDNNFFDNTVEISKKINLYINIKKTKIENIFLLIGIIPFLKNNSTITYKINKKEIYKLFKNIFINKKIKNKIIKLNEYDMKFFIEKINYLINYKWELIPLKKISNNIRHIINNYYNESCLIIFDKSLNLNFKYYIQSKKNKLSINDIKDLMSKSYNYLTNFIYRKYWNL